MTTIVEKGGRLEIETAEGFGAPALKKEVDRLFDRPSLIETTKSPWSIRRVFLTSEVHQARVVQILGMASPKVVFS
jgi:hypothetical protein